MGRTLKRIRHAFLGMFPKKGDLFVLNEGGVKSCRLFGMPEKHVFFGYYDLPQLSADGSKMLAHIADKKAEPAERHAEIGFFDLFAGQYQGITSTSAWCLQQGSRLRWHPTEPDAVLYNDVEDGCYVTKAADLGTGERRIAAPALYDVSCDFKYGVSVNFARLQRLRPGYGYGTLPDLTAGNPAPDDDGVFLVDLRDKSATLVASLRELAQRSGGISGEHYINHISFSPDGRRFIFYHVAKAPGKGVSRAIKLYIYDIEKGNLEVLEDEWRTSHYTWRSGNELLVTEQKGEATRYSIHDIHVKSKRVIEHNALEADGHPSFFENRDRFVTDTYPGKGSYQRLFVFDMMRCETELLAKFYHKPQKTNDMRCDLHPRLWEKEGKQVVTLDTTCSGGVRKVALLEL